MKKIGLIGIGNMGYAMLKGAKEVFGSEALTYTDTSSERMEFVKNQTGIAYKEDNCRLVRDCDYIILAVKPQYIDVLLEEIKPVVTEDKIIISILPGMEIAAFKKALGQTVKIVRTMPNTPALVGKGMTAICFSPDSFTDEQKKVVFDFFQAFGKYEMLEEKLLDAAVVASGSSPAYVYMFIEALADSAVKYGIPRDTAYRMVAQTVLGSAEMVLKTNEHPGMLKDKVCSPGGTTIDGVAALEEWGFRNSIIKASDRCFDKIMNIKK